MGFSVTNCHKPLYVVLGKLAKLVSYTFVFYPVLVMTGGLGETVVCFWYTFWCRVIESLLDSGVITKETLLSFETLPNDPERAVGPAQALRGSCWVRSQMEEGRPGGASDLVKVERSGSGLKPQAHLSHTGPEIPPPSVQ